MSITEDATEALIFHIENLKQILVSNIDALDVRTRVTEDTPSRFLESLEVLKASLEAQKNDNRRLKLKEIRSLLHKVEDAYESCIVNELLHRTRNPFTRAAHAMDYAVGLRNSKKEIQAVTSRIRAVINEDLEEDAYPPIQDIPEASEKDAVGIKESVVGFEDTAKEVIKLLTGESEHLEVISIVGVLGLGKTTLAEKVLDDPEIKDKFPIRVFIHVSEEYQRKELFLNILDSVSQLTNEVKKMREEELATYLRKQLEPRKYLIVMDDVRKKEDWDKLKIAFSNNKNCSRVLITTRKAYVAAHANPSIKPLYLNFLKLNESRALLCRKVFGENNCPKELEAYELLIATKCDGIPLAIVSAANTLLKDPENSYWWETVAKSLNDFIPSYNSKDLIIQSYKHLPYRLKLCFLYLMMLPKDFEMPVWKLIRLWIAEGFIPSEGDLELEDRAEKYLEELVGRNLVMVGERRSNGRIKTCRIYGPLRHFCKKEVTEENLFQEIEKGMPTLVEHRRLCINSNLMGYISCKPLGDRVRSFLFFASEETTLRPELVSVILKAYKLLRVLDAKSLLFRRFPTDILRFFCLKYLAISSHITNLPQRMSHLQNMQTMIIETTSGILEIKADIWKMRQLRHLHVNAPAILPRTDEAEEANANLQTLSIISVESIRKEVLGRTPKLRKLAIGGRMAELFESNNEVECLCKLEYLENLKLLNDCDDITTRLNSLPPQINFLRKLKELTLLNTLLPWRQISVLGKHENLEVLKLKNNAIFGDIWQTETGGFRRLEVLHIGLTKLMFWEASADHFPKLKCLKLKHCSELRLLPFGLGYIPSLQTIDLYYTNPSVVSSARDIQLLKQQRGSRSNGIKLSVYPPDE
ncbi:hypothetical protein ACH5RR_031868 [Cinchona calisaya]|uniref:Uncharacterized protein n=1 Tax=Cinchona calisaya TaxID=153742 RepID=A0ABD2YIE3_9GENT